MIQNHTVTSGNLLSTARRALTASDFVVSVMAPDRTDAWLSQR
jgi:hypothetical protein